MAIVMLAMALPGVSVLNMSEAMFLAIMFGAVNAAVRPVIHYLEIPFTPLAIFIFSILPNAALALWASMTAPAIFVENAAGLFLYVSVLSVVVTGITMRPNVVPALYEFLAMLVRTIARTAADRSFDIVRRTAGRLPRLIPSRGLMTHSLRDRRALKA